MLPLLSKLGENRENFIFNRVHLPDNWPALGDEDSGYNILGTPQHMPLRGALFARSDGLPLFQNHLLQFFCRINVAGKGNPQLQKLWILFLQNPPDDGLCRQTF